MKLNYFNLVNNCILLLLLFLHCTITYSSNQLLFYTQDGTEVNGEGFGVLINGSVFEITDIRLNGDIDSLRSGLSIVGKHQVVVYGFFQFWNNTDVGNLLIYEMKTKSWGLFGQSGKIVLNSKTVDRVIPFFAPSSQFLVVGQSLQLSETNGAALNSLALCDASFYACSSLGTGLRRYQMYAGSVIITGVIYIAYFTDDDRYIIQYFDGIQTDWNVILNITLDVSPSLSTESLAAYGGRLVSSYISSSTPDIILCEDTPSVNIIGVWKDGCWSNLLNKTQFNSNDASSLLSTTFEGKEILYLIYDYGSALGTWDGKSWKKLLGLQTLCDYFSPPMIVVENSIMYIQCQMLDDYASILVKIDIDAELLSYLQDSACRNPIGYDIDPGNKYIWYECAQDNDLRVGVVSTANFTTIEITAVGNLTNIPKIVSMCSFGQNIFISGNFNGAGNQIVSSGLAIWNGTAWLSPDLPDYNVTNHPSSLLCASNDTHLWLSYMVLKNNSKVAVRLVIVTQLGEMTTYTSENQYLDGTLHLMTLVDSRYIILSFFNLDTTLALYDIERNLWNFTKFSVLSQNTYLTSIFGKNGVVYFSGALQFKIKNVTFSNIAKYNLIEDHWMEIGPVEGLIYSMVVVDDNLFAGGDIVKAGSIDVKGLAVCNSKGVWINQISDGLRLDTIHQMVYLDHYPILYITVKGDENTKLFSYDFNCTIQEVPSITPLRIDQFVMPNSEDIYMDTIPLRRIDKLSSLIILLIGLGIVIVATLVAAILISRRHKSQTFARLPVYLGNDSTTNIKMLLDDPSINKIDEREINFLEVIGGGGQGIVQKALYKEREVAVKTIPVHSDDLIARFMQEIKILSMVKHKNIVEFIGVMVMKRTNKICLVTELMDTDVRSVSKLLSYEEKLQVAKDICSAMVYLNKQNPPILHRDLKLSNVLISKDGRCKITDFGVSRLKPDVTMTITGNLGTLSYAAPEVLMKGKYNESADIYSFGILLAELLDDGRNPFGHVQYEWSIEFIRKFTNKEIQPKMPENIAPNLAELIDRCISWNPEQRPTFIEVYQLLESLVLQRKGYKIDYKRKKEESRSLPTIN